MKKETIYLIVTVLVAIIGGVIFYFGGKEALKTKKEQNQENLVACLREKNIKVYGSSTCPYCQRQKEILGETFSKINYIECLDEKSWSKICIDDEINNVPTWSFPKNSDIEKKLLSCIECAKGSKKMLCKDYCYDVSNNGRELRVVGFIGLEKLSEIAGCSLKED